MTTQEARRAIDQLDEFLEIEVAPGHLVQDMDINAALSILREAVQRVKA